MTQVRVGFQDVSARGGDEAVKRGTCFCAFHGVRIEPIATAKSEGPDRIFRQVVVYGETRILNVTHELGPLGQQIAERLTELARGHRLVLYFGGPFVQRLQLGNRFICSYARAFLAI